MSFLASNPDSFLGRLSEFVIYLRPAKPKAWDVSILRKGLCQTQGQSSNSARADPLITCPNQKGSQT